MKHIIYKANERGYVDHGWLKARHYFSFGNWYDNSKIHFGALRVVNDDHIEAGEGFGTHPHDNMEIITIPTLGELEHKDSMGNGSVISTGEIQVMSAGKGIQHSEFNPSAGNPTELFQIWIFPKSRDIEPRYSQARFSTGELKDKLKFMVGPDDDRGLLHINQNAWISLSLLSENKLLDYKLKDPGNGVFCILVDGKADVENISLDKRDAIGIYDINEIEIKATKDAFFIFIEVPMQF